MTRPSRLRFATPSLGLLTAIGVSAFASPAAAVDPILRHQEDLHGDVAVFGSTLAYDCGAGVSAPAGSTASCASETNTSDTAPDLYWRDNLANSSITPKQARTSATLVLPAGAKVTYARLYWAALQQGVVQSPDLDVTLDWLGGPQQVITADDSWTIPYALAAHPDWYYYQASGDATTFVAQWGAGDFRVTDVDALPLAGQAFDADRAFSAWTLVVFYDAPGDELRNLALFDGFTGIDPALPGQESASVNLSGFLVPQGFSAKMSAFTYEGDAIYSGDHFTLNGAQVTDAQNPLDNFFNSSRSALGAAVSGSADIPKLSGAPGTMAGYDLDTIDITSKISAGDTSAVVGADSTLDIFFLGGFVTSVTALAPFFTPTKTVTDLNGGAVVEGDILEYTILGTNTGNDASAGTVLTDVIDPGLAFVPGSIQVIQGANPGTKTDAAGDDQGEYSSGSKTVTVRLGTGATASLGGSIAVGSTFEVRFKATVAVDSGTVANQASIKASGASGSPTQTYNSDGDPATVAADPTVVDVGQCETDADCPADKPHCDPVNNTCGPCESDADCLDPLAPACQPNGTCGECSSSNEVLCVGDETVCDTAAGICVLCTLGPNGDSTPCELSVDGPVCVGGAGGTVHCGCNEDPDCGGPKSGVVCDTIPQICIDGCRGEGGNGCPDGMMCTSVDTSIGDCVPIDGGPSSSSGGTTGNGANNSGEEGGCACSAPGDDSGSGTGAALAALFGALAIAVRRRQSSAKKS